MTSTIAPPRKPTTGARPTSPPADFRTDPLIHLNQDEPVNTTELTTFDIPRPAREPLAPDSPRPPGAEPEPTAAESLAARAPVARCADGNGTLTALFFSDHVGDIARAKAMCGLCPMSESCLADALEREEPWGVWGGELLSGGRIVTNKRPCGRPPKHPRPEIVYDELGPVGVVA